MAPALIMTLARRLVAGMPIRTWDTFGELFVNVTVIILWIVLTIAAYGVLIFYLKLWANIADRTTPALVAGSAALAAASVHLYPMRRSRAHSASAPSRMNLWAVSGLCVLAIVFKPELFGSIGVSVSRDYVRPALRTIGISPIGGF
jgi:hypothetical protein